MAPDDLGELARQARMFLLMDVLEHIRDDFQLFSKLLAASAPGCYFLLTVPADESLWSEHDESFGHYRRYDKERLQKVWDGLPASALLFSYFNSRLLPIVRAVRKWNRVRGRAAGRRGPISGCPAGLATLYWSEHLPARASGWLKCLKGNDCRGISPARVCWLCCDMKKEPLLFAVSRRACRPITWRSFFASRLTLVNECG